MNWGITRLPSATGLTLCLGLAFTPLGCGGGQDFAIEPLSGTYEGPMAPKSTVARLKECAEGGAPHLKDISYGLLVDLDVTESGAVRKVKVRESTIPDSGMESCMVGALEAMAVPVSILAMRSSQRISSGMVSPEARAYTGYIAVLGGAVVSLVPIVLVAAGVTILVAVTLHVADETFEAMKRRRTVEKKCYPPFYGCLGNRKQPEWNRELYGTHKDCQACFGQCMKANGEWPDDKCPRSDYRPN